MDVAVRKDLNPYIERTCFFMRYFTCLIWMPNGIFFFSILQLQLDKLDIYRLSRLEAQKI